MKIEIFGLPGVGKTHILDLMSEKYPEIHKYFFKYDFAPWWETAYDFLYYFKHPFLYFFCNLEKNRDGLLVRFKRIARRKKYIVKQNRCILDDSGIIQPLVEAYLLSEKYCLKIDWPKLFNELIMDHCYFFINDSIDDIVSRELDRGSRRFELNREELTVKYTECRKLIDMIKENMYYYEFSRPEYKSTNDMVDDLYKKMVGVLDHA